MPVTSTIHLPVKDTGGDVIADAGKEIAEFVKLSTSGLSTSQRKIDREPVKSCVTRLVLPDGQRP